MTRALAFFTIHILSILFGVGHLPILSSFLSLAAHVVLLVISSLSFARLIHLMMHILSGAQGKTRRDWRMSVVLSLCSQSFTASNYTMEGTSQLPSASR